MMASSRSRSCEEGVFIRLKELVIYLTKKLGYSIIATLQIETQTAWRRVNEADNPRALRRNGNA